ncbi:MAG: DUF4383 domain-containing protein [Solirubrobacteraceae bacterium]
MSDSALTSSAIGKTPWSPAQLAALVMGVWWTSNGIGAWFIDSNLATGHVHGSGSLFGLTTITANGWHALFHLLPGLAGIAVAARPRASLVYTLAAGAMYVVIGAWGLLAGGNSLGVIAVDAPGDVVHIAEGAIVFSAGLLTLARVTSPA